jgi:hypothetical protein
MRKLPIFAALTAALLLAGCVTTGIPKLDSIIDRVQQEAAKRCGFVPSIPTVGALLEMFGVAGASAVTAVVANVANKVCTAVNKPPEVVPAAAGQRAGRRGSLSAPVVCSADKCVTINGYFVR